jgi:(S)-ureidoglycine-glyoxylate aminotransferase
VSELRRQIGGLMGTVRPVIVMLGAADRFMELAVRSLVLRRVLVLVDGPRGERFAGIAEACGREVARTGVAPGLVMQPEWLERFLRGPECDAVALVHSEGDDKAPTLLAELATVARRRGVFVIADLTHSLGRLPVETDAWGLDLVFAAGSGSLAGPDWLSVGAASARAVERARLMPARGVGFDLVAHHEAAVEEKTLDPLPEPLDALRERFSGLRS